MALNTAVQSFISSASTGYWCQQAQDKAAFGGTAEQTDSDKQAIARAVYQYLDDGDLGQFQKYIYIFRNTTVLSWREKHHVNLGGEESDTVFFREAAGRGEATLGLELSHLDSNPDSVT